MVITWYGLSSLKISSGNFTLITDPFDKNSGLTPPRNKGDVVISSKDETDYNNFQSVSGEGTFLIDGPGEFDVKGIFVRGTPAPNKTTIYRVDLEGITLGFLGSLKEKKLSDEQLDALNEIDILFVPTGGKVVCDPEEAVAINNQIQPKIVIPIHYAQKGLKQKLEKVDVFLKEIGAKTEAQEKLTIKKNNLTQEKTEIIVLKAEK